MKKTVDEIVKEYINIATLEGETKLNGNYKRGNYLTKKLSKLMASISVDIEFTESVIDKVLASSADRARALASAEALRLGVCTTKAVATLEEVSKRPDIIGFSSRMTLEIWKGNIPGKTL